MLELLSAACAQVIVPEATEEAIRYYQINNIVWVLLQSMSLLIPLVLLLMGWTGKMERFSKKLGKNWFFTLLIYVVFFFAIMQVFELPLEFYAGYVKEHQFGLSTQSIGRWMSNYGKGFLVTLLSALSFVWIFYLLLAKSPRRWWIYCSGASIAILFFFMMVQPIWIDPLFNRFGSMKDKELEAQILHLASRAKIDEGRVFEVDKSRDTKMMNAYVTGFGKVNRIVLWDTMTEQMKPDQILFVMGHEMGHYVLHHVWWSFLYFCGLTVVIFYVTYRAANYLVSRFQTRFGFSELSSIASLPLLILLTSSLVLLSSPLSNYISRVMEHQADQFGIEITQNNQAAGEAFLTLQQANLANPRPGSLYMFWRATHPSLGERVDFFNSYCPWTEGKPLKYGQYFED